MDLKHCNTCGLDLPLTEFAKHPKGRQSKCKPCNRIYQRAHYRAHKAEYIAKAARWSGIRWRENAVRLLAFLEAHPCVDCGETDPVVLQFDHVRGDKVTDVSEMLGNGTSWENIAREMDKCEIRCANCHWRRHARDRGIRKLALVEGQYGAISTGTLRTAAPSSSG